MNTSDTGHPVGIRFGTRFGAAVAAALTVLLAAGCGSSKSSGTSNAASGSAATGSSTASTAAGAADGGASPSAADSTSTPPPSKPSGPASGGPHDCSTDMLKFTITPMHQPVNHVLITATNWTQQACRLNKYPDLLLDKAQKTPVKGAEATKPANAILLAPGASAYAGLMTSSADGSGKNGKNVPAVELQLVASDPAAAGVGRPTSVPMPSGADFVDDSAQVTYWVSDQQSAAY